MKPSPSDPTLEALVLRLRQRNWRCACAESCTGGGLAERLTRQAGSSTWFECGVVAYSNAAKATLLGVPEGVLATYGAVSEQVAGAMVAGLLQHSAAQTTAAITGIAGPGGGNEHKPVGTVVFAWAVRDQGLEVRTRQFLGNRHKVRGDAVEYALSAWAEYLDRLST